MGLRITKNNFALLLSLLLLLLLLLFANAMFMIRSDLFFLIKSHNHFTAFFPRWEILFSWFSRIFKLPQDHYGIKNLIFNFEFESKVYYSELWDLGFYGICKSTSILLKLK